MRILPNQIQVLVIDIQEKLYPHIYKKETVLQNSIKLIKGLKLFNAPFTLNEQYPKGIGITIAPIKELLEQEKVYEKVTFSCCKTDETLQQIKNHNKKFVIVFGIEAHVCVMQSVLDLLENDFIPVIVTDCIGSREPHNKEIAIQRMVQSGAIPATYESLLFELCVSAKNEVFKEISKIVK
jgi:nicotinamidase-related amidase